MKRVLCMPHGHALAHTTRLLEIAKGLRRKGHAVTFAGEGAYLAHVEAAGFPVLPVPSLDREETLEAARAGTNDWYDDAKLAAHVDAEVALFSRHRPDVVLGDLRPSLSISCELARVHYVSVLNASWTNYYAVRERAPEHFAPTRFLSRPVVSAVLPLAKRLVLRRQNRVYARFRRRRGMPARHNLFDTFRGDTTLICDVPTYGPTRDLPGRFKYVGPLVWEPALPAPDLGDVGSRKIVYVTIGSTGNAEMLVRLLPHFRGDEFVCVVSTAGLVEVPSPPPHVRVFDFVAGSKVMQRADVVVCQGGNGTLYQAMAAGVPIVGVPTMIDQEFNLDRVAQLGFGVHLSERRDGPSAVVAAARRVLSEPSYRAAARRMAAEIQRYDAPSRSAEIIGALSSSATPSG